MKQYTIWIMNSKTDHAEPYLSANPHTIENARRIAYGLVKKLGQQYYIEILDDTASDYSSVGTMSKSPYNTEMVIWRPSEMGNTNVYVVSPNGKIMSVKGMR